MIAGKKQNWSYVHVISCIIFGHYFMQNKHVKSSNMALTDTCLLLENDMSPVSYLHGNMIN